MVSDRGRTSEAESQAAIFTLGKLTAVFENNFSANFTSPHLLTPSYKTAVPVCHRVFLQ